MSKPVWHYILIRIFAVIIEINRMYNAEISYNSIKSCDQRIIALKWNFLVLFNDTFCNQIFPTFLLLLVTCWLHKSLLTLFLLK